MFPKITRVLLVDDHLLVLEGLSFLLSSFDGVEVIGTYTDGREAVDYYRQHGADIIITDMRMPAMDGVAVCAELRKINPNAKVLMLTMMDEDKYVREAVKMGVNGYVLKNADPDELVLAIRTVLDGRPYYSEELVVEFLVDKSEVLNPKQITSAKLTLRELEILRLVGKEMSTNEIAEKLFISVPTVETHRRNLMQKIGAKSVVGMVLFAVKNDLLDR